MTIFLLKTSLAIRECKSFKWDYSSSNDAGVQNQVVSCSFKDDKEDFDLMCICTTMCWSDVNTRDFRLTEAHKATGLNISSVISFKRFFKSPSEFVERAVLSMSVAAWKLSLQSDIGALSRRCKLAAEAIKIGESNYLESAHKHGSQPIYTSMPMSRKTEAYWFGNPTVRAVSKLVARMMQITLKVKSTTSLGDSSKSPLSCVMEGSRSWLVITTLGTSIVCSPKDMRNVDIDCTCNLWHMSAIGNVKRQCLARNCVIMLIAESGCHLDCAEFECLCRLLVTLGAATNTPSSASFSRSPHQCSLAR
jgi:hypothetical protein